MFITSLEITTRIGCTNNCSYCPQELLVREYRKHSNTTLMTFDTFKACVDKIDNDVEIHFTGMCEPFLNNDAIDMIEYAYPHKVRVSTTLIGLRLKDIKRLEDIDFIAFDVHLPARAGDNIPVNDKYIRLLKAVVNSTINSTAYHYHDRDLHNSIDFIEADMIKAHSRAGNVHWKEVALKTGIVKCSRKRKCPVLLPNGDLVICCMDYGLKHILGNLLTHNIDEIYKGRGYKSFIKALKKGGSICHFCDDFGEVKVERKKEKEN
jgi:sulfatase maturation enzyme AslB (radical SAM superfamily)